MRLASPILKRFLYPVLASTGQLRRHAGRGPAIVTYHGVMPAGYRVHDRNADWDLVRPESLRRQLKLLKDHYQVITPEQFRMWCESENELPPYAVLITCDDGMQSAFTEMMPILQDMDISGLFFVTEQALSDTRSMLWHEELHLMLLAAPTSVSLHLPELELDERATGLLEKRDLWWKLIHEFSQFDIDRRYELLEEVRCQIQVDSMWKSEYLDEPTRQSRFFTLNLNQTRAMAAQGMSIGAHSLSHPMLSKMPSDLAWKEIAEGRRRIEQVLQRPVWALAYPFGDVGSVGPREMEMAERAGYGCAFVNEGGGFGAPSCTFAMPRVHVTGDMGLSEFEAHLSGLHRTLRQQFHR